MMCNPIRGLTWAFNGQVCAYGISPVKTSNIMIPKEKTSIFSSYSLLANTSGAIHRQVPTHLVIPAWASVSKRRESPKSEIFALGWSAPHVMGFVNRTLQLFRSRCNMQGWLSCKYSIPLETSTMILTLCRHDSAGLLESWMRSYKLPPAQNSETMRYGALEVASKHFTKFGWLIWRTKDSHDWTREPALLFNRFTATVIALVAKPKDRHQIAL
mmetsp:Transcript_96073/g.277464  ORF Transcript_96073/g.277464 Transcript_96073/m.277464 type:complete len:214 (+) Transcript_96073:290-931(+)